MRNWLWAIVACAIIGAAFCAPALADSTPAPSASATPPEKKTVTLDDIFVTAQRRDTGQRGTPRVTFRIDLPELIRLGARTAADAIALLPGVVINEYGTPGHLQTALLRGASSTETLVLINGRPANEPGVGDFDFSSIPVIAIARIEVVEGAASTLYGSAAMGGVINIITRSPQRGENATVGATYGYEGAFASAIDANAGIGRSADAGIRVDAGTSYARSSFMYPASSGQPAGSLPNNDSNEQDAFVSAVDWLGPMRASLHVGDDASDNGEPGSLAFGPPSTLARQQRDLSRGDLTLEMPYERNAIALQAYSDGQRLHYYDPSFPYDTLAHLTTRGFDIRDTIRSGNDAYTFGYDGRGDQAQFDANFGGFPASSPARAATTGWYASAEHGQFLPLDWTAGIREERPQNFASTDASSIGLMYAPPSLNFIVRANYGRAFRVPALEETSPFFFGNPSLEPEYAATFDIGVSGQGNSLTYFGTHASNLIVSAPPFFVPMNVSLADIRGLALQYGALSGTGNHLVLGYTDYLRATDLTDGNRLSFRPTATGSVRLWHYNAPTGYGVTLRFIGRHYSDDPNTTSVPPSTTIGAYISRILGRTTTATLRLENVTNERVEMVPGYPVLGRTASVSVSTTWGK